MTLIIPTNDTEDNKASIIVNGLSFDVVVRDTRIINGKKHYLIMPIAGSGETWVKAIYKGGSKSCNQPLKG